jgi:hypothetical protein
MRHHCWHLWILTWSKQIRYALLASDAPDDRCTWGLCELRYHHAPLSDRPRRAGNPQLRLPPAHVSICSPQQHSSTVLQPAPVLSRPLPAHKFARHCRSRGFKAANSEQRARARACSCSSTMKLGLEQQICFVSGGSQGMGREIAKGALPSAETGTRSKHVAQSSTRRAPMS